MMVRYEIPPPTKTLLSKALSIWGSGSKPCPIQGMGKDPPCLRQHRKESLPLNFKRGTGKIPNPKFLPLLTMLLEVFPVLGERQEALPLAHKSFQDTNVGLPWGRGRNAETLRPRYTGPNKD